ncbi:ferric reductase NAD binding domain-containing protein [Cubamyces lactineus]|nr:ferric reductase NAD binding domain-containing protein [Cubamyces lactineus]
MPQPSGSTNAGDPGPSADYAIIAERNMTYPQQVWWLLACVIGSIAIAHVLSWLYATRCTQRPPVGAGGKQDTEGHGASYPRRFSWSRLPVALANYFKVVAFRNTVDLGENISVTFAETWLTIGYIVALFTWLFINTTDASGSALNWQYWSGRAGSLAVSQFPLITALGTKNSVLAYITGISYDKLNFMHRMTSRVVFILLWIATTPSESFQSLFLRLGLMAITAFTVLIIVSYRSIRARFYELFFFSHFALVLIMLLGAYFHAKQVTPLTYYIWPSLLVWAVDRFLRLLRVVYYNNFFLSGRTPPQGTKATLELLSPSFVRLRVARPPQLKWTPGQAAFLIVPSVSRIPIEAHPFTIAGVDSRYRVGMGRKAMPSAGDSRVTLCDSQGFAMGGDPDWEELEFMINVRDGFTKRLARAAEDGEKVKVLVDGPYGFSPNLREDDTVVLVAGGSGISLVLSTFLGLISDVRASKSKCRRVVFVWSIRDAKQLEWISTTLADALAMAPAEFDVSVRIFITSGSKNLTGNLRRLADGPSSPEPQSGRDTPVDDVVEMLSSFDAVQITPGRPELSKMLKSEISAAAGRLSVTVCGSQAIVKSCREALRIPFMSFMYGGPSVTLHVESFGYA